MAEEPDETPIDPSPPPAVPPRKRRLGRLVLLWLSLASGCSIALWNLFKPLPDGVSIRGAIVDTPLSELRFLSDVTGADVFGAPVVRQQIFDARARADRRCARIPGARFLPVQQPARQRRSAPRRIASCPIELRDALLARKRALPELRILVIADPINDVYGALPSRDLAALRGAGIDVVTRRPRLAARFEPYLLRLLAPHHALVVGRRLGRRQLPESARCRAGRVSFGAWARLLNFKANHRKVIIGDDGKGGITGIVTSANPHDASSLHSNVGIRLSGAALSPLLESELALAARRRLERSWDAPEMIATAVASPETTARVQVLTESEIRAAIVRNFAGARVGDSIDIAMFYLSDRDVIQALLAAAKRGVAVRVMLDPNKDAFGRTKNGIPNRSVATELARGFRRRDQGALVPHARRAVPQQAGGVAHRHGILVHARFGESHAAQPRGLQPRGQHRRERAAECRNRHADQRLVRVAVDQSRSAGTRVHRGIRRLCRSRRRAPTGSIA